MTLEIKIIRHAESEANVGDFFDNPATIKITDLGQQQAEALVSQLGKSEIILFSKFDRTYQTAFPYIEDNPDIPVAGSLFAHEFHYLNPEKFYSKTAEEKKEISKRYWTNADPFYKDYQEAESFDEFVKRVQNLILSFRELGVKNINLFSHGLVIKAIKLLTTEFPDLFLNENKYSVEIKKFMVRFYEIIHDPNFETTNASIHDLSTQINKYLQNF